MSISHVFPHASHPRLRMRLVIFTTRLTRASLETCLGTYRVVLLLRAAPAVVVITAHAPPGQPGLQVSATSSCSSFNCNCPSRCRYPQSESSHTSTPPFRHRRFIHPNPTGALQALQALQLRHNSRVEALQALQPYGRSRALASWSLRGAQTWNPYQLMINIEPDQALSRHLDLLEVRQQRGRDWPVW